MDGFVKVWCKQCEPFEMVRLIQTFEMVWNQTQLTDRYTFIFASCIYVTESFMASGVHVPLTTYLNVVFKGMVEHLQKINGTGCHASFHAGDLEA